MTALRVLAALTLAVGLSACAGFPPTTNGPDPARDAVAQAATRPAPDPAAFSDAVAVREIIVRVPKSLVVSEANLYLPPGDIVWRGDPRGDRHAQVQAIFEDAMARGTTGLDGPRPVDLDIEVTRFHALTEKARYTVGGVHAITFELTLRDPATGAALAPTRTVRADLDAYGGRKAVEAEARGETQKIRITDHLAEVIRTELTDPDGYRNVFLGFDQILNL